MISISRLPKAKRPYPSKDKTLLFSVQWHIRDSRPCSYLSCPHGRGLHPYGSLNHVVSHTDRRLIFISKGADEGSIRRIKGDLPVPLIPSSLDGNGGTTEIDSSRDPAIGDTVKLQCTHRCGPAPEACKNFPCRVPIYLSDCHG